MFPHLSVAGYVVKPAINSFTHRKIRRNFQRWIAPVSTKKNLSNTMPSILAPMFYVAHGFESNPSQQVLSEQALPNIPDNLPIKQAMAYF